MSLGVAHSRSSTYVRRVAPFASALMMAALALYFASCATLAPVADPWLPKAQQIVVDATDAYVTVMTRSGKAYDAIGVQCLAVHPKDPAAYDRCMAPADDAKRRVIGAANVYRHLAIRILTAKSWADVVDDLGTMRRAAVDLAREASNLGEDPVVIRELLTQPLDAAKER